MPLLDRTNQRFGRLLALRESGRDRQGRAMWWCRCDCGTEKAVPSRHLGSGAVVSCGCYGQEVSSRNGKAGADKLRGDRSPLFKDRIGYFGLHARIRSKRGPASQHSCVDCGKKARHWSYVPGQSDSLVEDRLLYSLNPDDYQPRCVRCHSAHDKALREGGKEQ